MSGAAEFSAAPPFYLFAVYNNSFRQLLERRPQNAYYLNNVIKRRLNLVALPFAYALLGGVHFQSEFLLVHIIKLPQIF